MRLSELLHSEVVDETGRSYGSIDDVRLVQDGPLFGTLAALRVDGVVVGRGALGVRLGFHRTAMRGPWLLNAIFGRLERRARFVPWTQVLSCEDGRVVISGEPAAVPKGGD
jgi:sporulation protein YlmC with PRC-barrel domain